MKETILDVLMFMFQSYVDDNEEVELDKESLHIVLDKLHGLLENDGELIVSDFLPTGHLRHKLLNYLMHGFFRLIANLASGSLLDIRSELLSNGYVEIAYRQENNGHMFSGRYQKALID